MNNYLSEAFKKLDILDEDVFELDKDGLTALKDFEDSDEDDTITVVDPDAESEEDLEDSYIGKVILDCSVCHTDIYKDKEDITIDEESGLANIGEECPYCYSSDGFKVIGEVKPFVEVEVDTDDDDVDAEVDGEEVEKNESFKRKSLRESISLGDLVSGDSATLMSPFYLGRTGEIADAGSIVEVSDLNGASSIPGGYHYRFYDKNGDLFYEDDLWLYNYDLDDYQDDSIVNPDLIKVKSNGSVNESLRKNRRLKESKKLNESPDGWEFIKYDGVGPVESDAYYKYVGNDIQLVIYPPQTVAGNTYDTWEAEIYTDNGSSYQSIDDTRDGFDSFEEAEAWINSKIKNLGESLNEKNLKESYSINQCQKWVDYDMKKYKKISNDTMEKIKSSGYSVVKDQYGDYEVIADRKDESCGKRKSRKIKESIEDITIDTGDQEITVSAKDKEKIESDGEMIAPLSDEVKADIETGSDDTVDVDVDEFSEEDFDELGESYLKKVYENVNGYKTTSAETKGNKLYVEGLIKFNSGKQKKTSFVFESRTITKTGKAKLIGENLQISRGHKSFKLTGTINNGKFISESLNYNYRVKNGNSSQRVYGTAKKSK